MNAQIENNVAVLSLSHCDTDHILLQAILSRSTWTLFKAFDVATALDLIPKHNIAVVLCEQTIPPKTYTYALSEIDGILTKPSPSFIVASRLADDFLWAEALNLGAWDVLSKPFVRDEVLRSIASGWQHWFNHNNDHCHVKTKTA